MEFLNVIGRNEGDGGWNECNLVVKWMLLSGIIRFMNEIGYV